MTGVMCLFLLQSLVFVLADQLTIKAQPGQTVTLPCQVPAHMTVIAAKWTRRDLGSHYVIFDKNGTYDEENQHPDYKNVYLHDRQNGNISLVIPNVTANNSGTYECQVFLGNKSWNKISTIELNVVLQDHRNESGEEEKKKNENNDGSNGLVVFIVVCAVFGVIVGLARVVGIVVVVDGAIIFAIKICNSLKGNSNQTSTEAAEQKNGLEMTTLDFKQ